MKKLLTTTTVCLLAASPLSHADLAGIGASIGYWDSDLSGKASKDSDTVDVEDDLDLSNNSEANLSAYFEHPVPLLPNVRLSYIRLDQTGRGELGSGFDGLPAGVPVDSELDWRQMDLTLYYEILDNWVNLDLGLTVRDLDAELKVSDVAGLYSSKTKVDGVVPMAYLDSRFDLPLTGLSVGLTGNLVSYGGDSLYDYDIYGQYQFWGVRLRAGYREMAVDWKDGDEKLDVDVGGPFASVGFSF